MTQADSFTGTRVLFFGQAKETAAAGETLLEGIRDTDALRAILYERFPGLKDMPFKLAVNKVIVHHNVVLHAGSEVAVLPPYSGG